MTLPERWRHWLSVLTLRLKTSITDHCGRINKTVKTIKSAPMCRTMRISHAKGRMDLENATVHLCFFVATGQTLQVKLQTSTSELMQKLPAVRKCMFVLFCVLQAIGLLAIASHTCTMVVQGPSIQKNSTHGFRHTKSIALAPCAPKSTIHIPGTSSAIGPSDISPGP